MGREQGGHHGGGASAARFVLEGGGEDPTPCIDGEASAGGVLGSDRTAGTGVALAICMWRRGRGAGGGV